MFGVLMMSGMLHAQPPNILIVIADDLGIDPVPNYLPGPEKAAMPNLEALMEQGLTFSTVWADPLCSPTRATIITGRYGRDTGVLNANQASLLPPDAITLHRYLDDIGSGYASALIGKWHLGGPTPSPGHPTSMGIPYYAGLLSGAAPSYANWNFTADGSTSPSDQYITTAFTDLAIDWIAGQSAPWLCWVAYTAPHSPFHLPPDSLHQQGDLPTDQASINADPLPYYLAMIESVDHEMGRLLRSLQPDVRANTVVVFLGDNGTPAQVIQSPYFQNHAKGTLYEGGVRVPLVIAGPGVGRMGEIEPALVNTSDLFATLVELTGHSLPTYHDSRSLVPLLSASDLTVRSCAYTEVLGTDGGHAIRDERYKLITFSSGPPAFHDLLNDPWEMVDLLTGTLTTEQQLAVDRLNAECEWTTTVTAPEGPAFGVYPQPVGDRAALTAIPGTAGPYRIFSSNGNEVLRGDISVGTMSIAVDRLSPGIHVLVLDGHAVRFIKE